MDRIEKLCSYLKKCNTFADVGCDHGYCTKYMLSNNLCGRAFVTDISAQCLKKAEKLLERYIKKGIVTPVCCNGLEGIDPLTEQVLIAGMGGEEIISIMERSFIPVNFVLQPMKNVRAVREYLLLHGARIGVDNVFESGGKYYFVLCGSREGGANSYNKAQLEFGKGDVKGALGAYLREEIEKKRGYLARDLNAQSRREILEQVEFMERILNDESC